MTDNKNSNVVQIDPTYIKYRKMWKEDRWMFSGELVKLSIKQGKTGELDNIEKHTLETLNRIIDENDGKWTEGYEYNDGMLSKVKKRR
jgi:hypothetical protein